MIDVPLAERPAAIFVVWLLNALASIFFYEAGQNTNQQKYLNERILEIMQSATVPKMGVAAVFFDRKLKAGMRTMLHPGLERGIESTRPQTTYLLRLNSSITSVGQAVNRNSLRLTLCQRAPSVYQLTTKKHRTRN